MKARSERSTGVAVSSVPVPNLLTLSAVALKYSSEFPAAVLPYDHDTFEELRRHRGVFAHRRTYGPFQGKLLVVPLDAQASGIPAMQMLQTHQNLAFVAQLIEVQLPTLLPDFELTRDGHAFDHVRTREDLLARSIEEAGLQRNTALELLHSYINVRFGIRYEHLESYGSLILMTIDLQRRYTCSATAADFLQRGVDLTGIGVIDLADDRFVGIVREASSAGLVVSGSRGEVTRGAHECRVSPAIGTFTKLFERSYSARELERWRTADRELEASTLAGRRHLQLVRELAADFSKRGMQRVVPGLTMSFGPVITPPAIALRHITYSFSRDDVAHSDNPVRGVEEHGPRDTGRFSAQVLRVGFLFPDERQVAVKKFASALFDGIDGYRGMVDIFRLPALVESFHPVKRGAAPTDHYLDLIASIRDLNLVFVVVEDVDTESRDNPYAAVMADLAQRGIPAHQLRASKLESSGDRTRFVLEDVGIAAYVKLGGRPWCLATPSEVSDFIIGLGYTTPRGADAKKRYRAITTVFDADGQFLGSAQTPLRSKDEYAESVEALLRVVLHHVGRDEKSRISVHAWPLLTDATASAMARALERYDRAVLTVRSDHPFRLFDDEVPTCVPARGTVADFGRLKKALCVHGDALLDHERREHPSPLLIELSDMSTMHDLNALTVQLYKLTGVYGGAIHTLREPATLYYVRQIAKQLARLDGSGRPHAMPSDVFEPLPWFL